MSKELILRRGTSAANNLFTGKEGEVTMDTETQGLRVHDGTTAGGHLIDTVIAFQAPNAGNNYTWYRKYSSGWVEQGGVGTTNSGNATKINLATPMANTGYHVMTQGETTYTTYSNATWQVMPTVESTNAPKTTTSFYAIGSITGYNLKFYWVVRGMGA